VLLHRLLRSSARLAWHEKLAHYSAMRSSLRGSNRWRRSTSIARSTLSPAVTRDLGLQRATMRPRPHDPATGSVSSAASRTRDDQALTFAASATAVLAVNATPVLVDVDADTLCIDSAAAEAAITDRTKAIVAVHVAGASCDLDALTELCARGGLRLIEDCAHAHGTFWRGRGVGSWGDFGSFSMQQSKLMTAGEGGVLICNDEAMRDRAWAYADCGRVKGKWFYHHATVGSNLRMTEWQGAVLRAQLERFPEQNRIRNENAVALNAALDEIDGIRTPCRDPRMDSQGNYCFVFHYDSDRFAGLPLHRFEAALAAEGIPMGVSYPSLSDLAVFRSANFGPRLRSRAPAIDYASLHLPRAEAAAASTVWLQHRLLLAEREDVLDVARAVARIQSHAGDLVNAQ
jgi:dTDP-4-amino-4,6-dideoxygalactose transaminase